MAENDPVSLWLDELRQGEQSAAQKIWQHFVMRLYQVARKRLALDTRRVYDEEDAAQSAFKSLCAGIVAGRFPDLSDRDGLWRLLVVITSRKVSHRHRYDRQERRNINRTVTDSVFLDQPLEGRLVETLASREPTPEFSAAFVETFESLFAGLDDPKLQEIARLKVEGYNDEEIAKELGCSRRTIQRKIERVRRAWSDSEA